MSETVRNGENVDGGKNVLMCVGWLKMTLRKETHTSSPREFVLLM